jgi:hypothetical protein
VLPALGRKRRPALLKNRPLKKIMVQADLISFSLLMFKESKKLNVFDSTEKFFYVHIEKIASPF